MAYRVQVASPAERDLDKAVDYLVDDERKIVSVIAFMHGSRDAVTIVGKRI